MFKTILVIVSLAAVLASANGTPEVTHRFTENVAGDRFHSIFTSDWNIAFTDLVLFSEDWATVSINKGQVVIYSPYCDVITKSVGEFAPHEKMMLSGVMGKFKENRIDVEYKAQNALVTHKIEVAGKGATGEIVNKNTDLRSKMFDLLSLGVFFDRLNEMPIEKMPKIPGVPMDDNGRYNLPKDELGLVRPPETPIDLKLDMDQEQLDALLGEPTKGIFMVQKDIAVLKLDEENFSITKSGLPNDLSRVFFNKNALTFVYNDGRVIMKPTNCMSVDEHELLDQLKKDVEEISSSYSS